MRAAVFVILFFLLATPLAAGCGASQGNSMADGEQVEGSVPTQEETPPEYATGIVTGLKPVHTLYVDAGPKSVELMPGGDRIFVNDLYAHENFIFDAATYELLKIIPLPDEPVETDFSPDGRYAWVSLYNLSKVVVVDTYAGSIVGEVTTGSVPKEIAVSPDGRWVYVANWDSNTVTVIDAQARTHVKDIYMYGTPRGMVFSPQGDKLYVCVMGGDTLAEVDVGAGHVVARQIYCGQNPRHAVLSPDGNTIYVSNNIPGTITYVDRIAGTVLATVKVGNKARTIAITPDGAYLFVCNYDDDTISCVDTAACTQIFTYSTTDPIGMTVDARGERLFVSNYAPPQITVLEIVRP
ncbi:MAG: beta-propeller fold lactonase family protein [Actinobacteria bacterium]|nr:beta-propeller fold lactonase family protein [Actinomycetota bacterium]